MGDLRLAWRRLRKTPTASAVAVITLTLAIGANTAILSVVKAVLLNPLPYRDSSRVVTLAITAPDMPGNETVDAITPEDQRERSRLVESLSIYGDASTVMVENGQGEIVRGLRVNANFFDTLGVKMQTRAGFSSRGGPAGPAVHGGHFEPRFLDAAVRRRSGNCGAGGAHPSPRNENRSAPTGRRNCCPKSRLRHPSAVGIRFKPHLADRPVNREIRKTSTLAAIRSPAPQ